MNLYLEKIASLSGTIKRIKVTLRQADGAKMRKFYKKYTEDSDRVTSAVKDLKTLVTGEGKVKGQFHPDKWLRNVTHKEDMASSAVSRFTASRNAFQRASKSTDAARAEIKSAKKIGAVTAVATGAIVSTGLAIRKKMKNRYLEKVSINKVPHAR